MMDFAPVETARECRQLFRDSRSRKNEAGAWKAQGQVYTATKVNFVQAQARGTPHPLIGGSA